MDVLAVHVGLALVVDEYHNDVGLLRGLGHGHDIKSIGLRLGPGIAALTQSDYHLAAAPTPSAANWYS